MDWFSFGSNENFKTKSLDLWPDSVQVGAIKVTYVYPIEKEYFPKR